MKLICQPYLESEHIVDYNTPEEQYVAQRHLTGCGGHYLQMSYQSLPICAEDGTSNSFPLGQTVQHPCVVLREVSL